MRCAICKRVTLHPAVLIGSEVIGPGCARKHGLHRLKPRKGSRIVVARPRAGRPAERGETADLFEEAARWME